MEVEARMNRAYLPSRLLPCHLRAAGLPHHKKTSLYPVGAGKLLFSTIKFDEPLRIICCSLVNNESMCGKYMMNHEYLGLLWSTVFFMNTMSGMTFSSGQP